MRITSEQGTAGRCKWCIVPSPQLAAFEMRWLPGTGSDLLVEFFSTDLHFLFCDDADNCPRERGPFFSELFYGLLPVAVTLSPALSFVWVPWSLLSYRDQHFPSGAEAKRTMLYHGTHSSSLAGRGSMLQVLRRRGSSILSFVLYDAPSINAKIRPRKSSSYTMNGLD
jgi:hypothetical protein